MINSLDAIIKSTNFAQKINNQLGISNSMIQMIHSQELWQNKLSAMTMSDAIFKSIAHQQNYFTKNIAGLDTLSKTMAIQSKIFQIPQPTLDAIKGISQMQESILGDLKGISSIFESQKNYLAQINSLQFAMNGISGQIAAIAAKHNQWVLLDEFEEINEEVFEITNNFTSDIALTKEESLRFEQLIERINIFYNENKKYGTYIWRFFEIILAIIAIHQYSDFLKPKAEPVTKIDLVNSETRIKKALELKFKEYKEFRITNRVTKVMLKPRTKTIMVALLPKDFDVIVLQINHKWAFVSFIDPKDNLTQTGWVMKKYIDKN